MLSWAKLWFRCVFIFMCHDDCSFMQRFKKNGLRFMQFFTSHFYTPTDSSIVCRIENGPHQNTQSKILYPIKSTKFTCHIYFSSDSTCDRTSKNMIHVQMQFGLHKKRKIFRIKPQVTCILTFQFTSSCQFHVQTVKRIAKDGLQ